MDNASIHSTLEMMKSYSDNKLRILFNVPYLYYFDMIELVFRILKTIFMENSSIKEVEKILIKLIEGEKFKKQLRII